MKNQEDLNRLRNDLELAQSVRDKSIIPQQELGRLIFSEAGQREMVEKLTQARDELRHRVDEKPADEVVASDAGRSLEQLRPILARIDLLTSERLRVVDELEEGMLRAPVDGVAVRCSQASGQRLGQLDTVLELVDSTSLQAMLFAYQGDTRSLAPGTEVTVTVETLSQPVLCRVVSSRERFEEAPSSIQRYYRKGEPLLPVVLHLQVEPGEQGILRHGALVRFGWFSKLESCRVEGRERRVERG